MSPLASFAVSAPTGAELFKESGVPSDRSWSMGWQKGRMVSQEAQARLCADTQTAIQEFRRSFRLK
jgi:hypothetical protein